MDYRQATKFIESTYRFGSRPGLKNITRLLDLMGNPHRGYKTVHVAGTNGKGSTCAFIASVLNERGFLTGLYTSPHLERITERIKVADREISQGDMSEITAFVKGHIKDMLMEGRPHPTEFELLTAIGFEYFKRKDVKYAVIEVGMGGRLDATNVINPEVSVITPIGLDHIYVLGKDCVSIAREKSGIIKPGIPVFCGPQREDVRDVIRNQCIKKNAPFIYAGGSSIKNQRPNTKGQVFDLEWNGNEYKDIEIGLLGRHQAYNASLAFLVCLKLGISEDIIRKGLKKARWPGRMEILKRSPLILIDGAHNEGGAKSLVKGLEQFFPDKKVLLILGMLKDKEVDKVANILAGYACVDKVVTVSPLSVRSLEPQALKEVVKKYNTNADCAYTVARAVDKYVTQSEKRMIVFAGSLYMIGEARKLLSPDVF